MVRNFLLFSRLNLFVSNLYPFVLMLMLIFGVSMFHFSFLIFPSYIIPWHDAIPSQCKIAIGRCLHEVNNRSPRPPRGQLLSLSLFPLFHPFSSHMHLLRTIHAVPSNMERVFYGFQLLMPLPQHSCTIRTLEFEKG